MSPLAGVRVTYLWQEFREKGCLVVREFNFKTKNERVIEERDLAKIEAADVFRRVEEAKSDALGDYSGKVKDGVFYTLCWGHTTQLSILRINNPQAGAKRHDEFIKMLKALALGQGK